MPPAPSIIDPAFRANLFTQAIHCTHTVYGDCYLFEVQGVPTQKSTTGQTVETAPNTTTTGTTTGGLGTTTYNLVNQQPTRTTNYTLVESITAVTYYGIAMSVVGGTLFSDIITNFTVQTLP